jgi:hypothetical protein
MQPRGVEILSALLTALVGIVSFRHGNRAAGRSQRRVEAYSTAHSLTSDISAVILSVGLFLARDRTISF